MEEEYMHCFIRPFVLSVKFNETIVTHHLRKITRKEECYFLELTRKLS